MKLSAITRVKNGVLLQAIQKAGISYLELSRRSGLSYQRILTLASMVRAPSEKTLLAVQKSLGEAGVYVSIEELWPEGFRGFKKGIIIEQSAEVDSSRLIEYAEHVQAQIQDSIDVERLEKQLREYLPRLKPRDSKLLRDAVDGVPIKETARSLNLDQRSVVSLRWVAARRAQKELLKDEKELEEMNV